MAWSVYSVVSLSVTRAYCAKMAERIKMPLFLREYSWGHTTYYVKGGRISAWGLVCCWS